MIGLSQWMVGSEGSGKEGVWESVWEGREEKNE